MPTYEYACDACEHTFEEFQSITAPALRKCPECGKPKLRRLIGTGGGVIFKGSGFYLTDYRSESYKQAAAADKPASTSTEGASKDAKPAEGKAGESKPATPPGSKPDAPGTTERSPSSAKPESAGKADSKRGGTGRKRTS